MNIEAGPLITAGSIVLSAGILVAELRSLGRKVSEVVTTLNGVPGDDTRRGLVRRVDRVEVRVERIEDHLGLEATGVHSPAVR